MRRLERTALEWMILALLAALMVTNVAFLLLEQTGGPIFGIVFNAALLIVAWRAGPNATRGVMLGGLLGLAIHVAEVAVMDDPDYPLLLWLNVVLPAVLALAAWCLERRLRRVGAS